jgi:3-hydroxyisobutyrate dehydrogenase-like beta-hydroxyacid dehydrogenase
MNKNRIGFIGLGNMGGRMTRVWSTRASPCSATTPCVGASTAAGAKVAGSWVR